MSTSFFRVKFLPSSIQIVGSGAAKDLRTTTTTRLIHGVGSHVMAEIGFALRSAIGAGRAVGAACGIKPKSGILGCR